MHVNYDFFSRRYPSVFITIRASCYESETHLATAIDALFSYY